MTFTIWEILKLSVDVGLLVLIWMVQLLIYPSFCHFGAAGFQKWHAIHMRNITFIVLPLMLGQLVLSGYLLFYVQEFTLVRILDFILVGSMWLSTALFYKPLHERLIQEPQNVHLCHRLEKTNWWRVAVWTLIVLLHLI
ncbi:hypothetical protein [Nonlabens antarcticus]|uniref:hypothetical protein n=1 Tax=Nonlabens antarcticus TaxID=392714 RepID=UPI001891DC6E|nr:hypothetical protein [Nonlabens antarcticus]